MKYVFEFFLYVAVFAGVIGGALFALHVLASTQ
jgi:hypothetical protein